LFQNYRISQTDRFLDRKDGTAIAVRKGIPYNHVDLLLLVSVQVCIPMDSSDMLLAAVCKSPGRARSDAYVIELLSFRHQSVLTSTSILEERSFKSFERKLLDLFDVNEFEISELQCPIHYSPAGNSNLPDTVVDQNIRL
jgi:hypothetical protein